MPEKFKYGIDTLTIGNAIALANGRLKGIINAEASKKIHESHDHVKQIIENNKTVYGINTGFGILANTKISEEDTATLQYKILQSHSVGVGDPIPVEVAKLMLITKVQALAQGYSGIQLSTIERIIWHIENDIIPVVPEKGSVGASGDLAPLSHLFLPLIGLGECYYKGERKHTSEIFQKEKIKSISLGPKEGLALINGTQFILSFAVKAVQRMHNCLEAADIIGAMSL
ncbi:MAG TPA: aromatic amino acid ammonia-lyase, partial [Chitinophagaceae bacterium]